jgi:hypothetical protein
MMSFSFIALWALVGAGMNYLGQFRRPSPVRSRVFAASGFVPSLRGQLSNEAR